MRVTSPSAVFISEFPDSRLLKASDTHFTLTDGLNAAAALQPIDREGSEYHLALYGCEAPGFWNESAPTSVWNCDSDRGSAPEGLLSATNCAPHRLSNLLYQVTIDSPTVQPPPGSGFKVGGDTGLNFLVLRVHHEGLDRFMRERGLQSVKTSKAGFRMRVASGKETEQPLKRVSIAVIGSHGVIPPKNVAHLEAAYKFRTPGLVMRPFALQVHTHSLGRAVTTWKVTPEGEWSLIAQRDPQAPEFFVPITRPDILIREGDLIAMRCTMNNTMDRVVSVR